MAEVKHKRRPKFTTDELDALDDGVSIRKDTIYNKFSDVLTNKSKNDAWVSITSIINAVSKVKRDVSEVRRKWKDWQSAVRAKEQRRRRELQKTGGGGKIFSVTPAEEKVVSLIGKAAIEVIPDGIDSGNLDPKKMRLSSSPEPHDVEGETIIEAGDSVSPKTCQGEASDPSYDPVDVVNEVSDVHDHDVLNKRLLKVEEEHLSVKKDRLAIERRRLAVEEETLKLLQDIVTRSRPSIDGSRTDADIKIIDI